MKILKATKVFLKKLITKIISAFKKKEEPLVENTDAGYAKTASELMIREYENLINRDDKKCLFHKKYVIMNGRRVLGYVTSKQKLFGILNYDFSTNHKRCIYFDTKEEVFKFMVDEYRSCFNKMWNIDFMFRYPINGYNQAQGRKLIRYYVIQLNNSEIRTEVVCNSDEIVLKK